MTCDGRKRDRNKTERPDNFLDRGPGKAYNEKADIFEVYISYSYFIGSNICCIFDAFEIRIDDIIFHAAYRFFQVGTDRAAYRPAYVFGNKNQRLIRKIHKQYPDLILITGDLLNDNEGRTDIAVGLIRDLTEIAPVYVSYGNHERNFSKKQQVSIGAAYEEAGTTVLERSFVDVEVHGQPIRIGGLYGYCVPEKYLSSGEVEPAECRFMHDFLDTDRYTILMCHIPFSWLRLGALEEWNTDLTLTGHIHGGQIRFPFIGGLWAPDQGWFPGKVCGLYISEDGLRHMILSRGLGNTEIIPRFNNIPEIVVVDLKAAA